MSKEKEIDVYTQLFEFQRKGVVVPFDAQVSYGNTRFRYATLNGIMEMIRPMLIELGLVVFWTVDEERVISVVLRHPESKTEIHSGYRIPDIKSAQELGSWFTYMKRYLISGLLGLVTDEDTDGPRPGSQGKRENSANGTKTTVKKKKAVDTEEKLNQVIKYLVGGGKWKVVFDNYDLSKEQIEQIEETMNM